MNIFKKADIRNEVLDKLQNDPNLFYKSKFLNYSGKPADSEEPYVEIIANELINNYNLVMKIGENSPIRKVKCFNAHPSHIPNVKSRLERFKQLEYCERLLAIALYNSNKTYSIGKIFDYEVPLKEKQSDKYGKIDIVSKDDDKQSIKLIELKIKAKNENDETLLRALLEVYTYYKLIRNSFDKFLMDYKDRLASDKYKRFQPVILTDKEALSGKTLSDIKIYPSIQTLISKMNDEIGGKIEGYVYNYPNRNEPFQEIEHKIMLQGDITIMQMI